MTLNCNNGSAHVEWVASQPGCQYDCTVRWTCKNHTNSTDPHEDVVSSCLEYLYTYIGSYVATHFIVNEVITM